MDEQKLEQLSSELQILKSEWYLLKEQVNMLQHTSCHCKQKESVKEAIVAVRKMTENLNSLAVEIDAADSETVSNLNTRIAALEAELAMNVLAKRVAL